MNSPILDLGLELQKTDDPEVFWNLVSNALRSYGITSLFYGLIPNIKDAEVNSISRSIFWKSNHSQEYFDVFPRESFLDNELSVLRAVTSYLPTLWHDESLWDNQDPELKKRSDREVELGFEVGVSVPLQLPLEGFSLSAASVCAGHHSPEEFDSMWSDKSTEILQILQLLDTGMRRRHLSATIGLSPREKDCLSWLVAGLRPDQIAERLGIGYKSVDKYISGAKRKLRASTRDQAVARALILNAIQP